MEFTHYARKPFTVEAVQVTKDNIAEIAALGVGELKTNDKGVPFIQVNRQVVPHVYRVYIGFWFTKTEDGNIRCYSRKVFGKQYVELDDAAHFALAPYMRGNEEKPAEPVRSNLFTDPPVTSGKSLEEIEGEQHAKLDSPVPKEIPKGGTYAPGVISPPPEAGTRDPAEEHRVVQDPPTE